MIFWFLILMNFIVEFLDIHSTYLCLNKGREIEREANPIPRFLFKLLGFKNGVIVMLFLFISIITYSVFLQDEKSFIYLWIFIAMARAVVVINNYKIYRETKLERKI